MRKSIVQDPSDRKCFICGSTQLLEWHHMIHGTGNRKIADREGLCVWLCLYHHKSLHDTDPKLDLHIKQIAQRVWEKKKGTREQWIKLFHKSWL